MILLHFRYTYAISSRHRFPLCCGHLEPKYQPISQPETPHVITSFQSSRLIIHGATKLKFGYVLFAIFVAVCFISEKAFGKLTWSAEQRKQRRVKLPRSCLLKSSCQVKKLLYLSTQIHFLTGGERVMGQNSLTP